MFEEEDDDEDKEEEKEAKVLRERRGWEGDELGPSFILRVWS